MLIQVRLFALTPCGDRAVSRRERLSDSANRLRETSHTAERWARARGASKKGEMGGCGSRDPCVDYLLGYSGDSTRTKLNHENKVGGTRLELVVSGRTECAC